MDFELEIDGLDLLNTMGKNVKEDIKDFDDFLNLHNALTRSIFIGEINEGVGDCVDSYIRFWNYYDNVKNIPIEEREPIKIYIDSPGGYLLDALTIIDSIRLSKTPVVGICIGTAYSGGFFILLSCHQRIAYPHASFLFHEGSTSNGGTASQFENYTAFYKKQLNQLKEVVLQYTNITEEEYEKIRKDDIWYDTAEALEKGIIDKITEEFI